MLPVLLFNMVLLLFVFYWIDRRAYHLDIAAGLKPDISKPGTEVKIKGLHNLIFLAMIVAAVILSGTLPGLPAFQDAAGNVKGLHIFGEVTLGYPSIIEIVIILLAAFLCIQLTIRQWIGVEINGSITLFLCATALYLFFTTGLGLFLGTIARSMPQMGLLFILIVLPMNLLSGGLTPLESMPEILQKIMSVVPSTNYIKLAQAILFRDAGLSIVWPEMVMVTVVGLLLFIYSTLRFRSFLERQG